MGPNCLGVYNSEGVRHHADLKRMAFFDESAIPDRVYYIGGYSALEAGGLEALVTLIRGAIQKHRATLLVVRQVGGVHASRFSIRRQNPTHDYTRTPVAARQGPAPAVPAGNGWLGWQARPAVDPVTAVA
jgi:hypothetical protein